MTQHKFHFVDKLKRNIVTQANTEKYEYDFKLK